MQFSPLVPTTCTTYLSAMNSADSLHERWYHRWPKECSGLPHHYPRCWSYSWCGLRWFSSPSRRPRSKEWHPSSPVHTRRSFQPGMIHMIINKQGHKKLSFKTGLHKYGTHTLFSVFQENLFRSTIILKYGDIANLFTPFLTKQSPDKSNLRRLQSSLYWQIYWQCTGNQVWT